MPKILPDHQYGQTIYGNLHFRLRNEEQVCRAKALIEKVLVASGYSSFDGSIEPDKIRFRRAVYDTNNRRKGTIASSIEIQSSWVRRTGSFAYPRFHLKLLSIYVGGISLFRLKVKFTIHKDVKQHIKAIENNKKGATFLEARSIEELAPYR